MTQAAVRVRVPDEVIEGYRQLSEDEDDIRWRQGDYLAGVVDELSPLIQRAEIHRQFADSVGCTRDTIRDREVMARFWHDRRAYYPLTYSQLRACKGAGTRAREYAEWALANLPAPVAVIWARVRANGDDVPAWSVRWERVQHLCALMIDDKDTPEVIRGICEGVVSYAHR